MTLIELCNVSAIESPELSENRTACIPVLYTATFVCRLSHSLLPKAELSFSLCALMSLSAMASADIILPR